MKGYDPACYELAAYFLPSNASARLKDGLAQAIQDAVEDWLTAERDRIAQAIEASGRRQI